MTASSAAWVRNASGVSCPAVLDPDIVSVYPSWRPQSIFEGCCTQQPFRVVGAEAHQHADAPNSPCLLRARCERPRCRAAQQRHELASF
jgi:hypothetical protein